MNILKTIKLIILLAFLGLGSSFTREAMAQPGVSVPVESFYNELAPYGQWLPNPTYGSVWVPNVDPNFQPYATNGHWIVTDFGNTWVSDYAWGWAPFHYGRWYVDNQYGWAWVPGSDWGPAWVSWRSGGGYYGWAPLAPGWDINMNVNIPAPYWTFVPQIYITSPNLYSYYVPRPNLFNVYQNTVFFSNIYRSNNRAYVYGPPRGDIERYTRQSVPVYRIDQMDRPGRSVIGNGSVGFYRPGRSPGYGQGYSQGYGRNDRFDNSGRPNYGGNNPSNGGYYGGGNNPNRDYNGNNSPNRDYNGGNTPNRDYNGGNNPNYNGNNTPNRDYNGNTNAPNRGGYGGNTPTNPGNNGNYNATPTPANPQQNRYDNNRGGYSQGNGQQGNAGNVPQSQPNRQPQMNSQPMPSGRNGGEIHMAPQGGGRGMQNQPQQSQPQRQGGGPGEGRGPR